MINMKLGLIKVVVMLKMITKKIINIKCNLNQMFNLILIMPDRKHRMIKILKIS